MLPLMRYGKDMTGLLEEALRRVASLPSDEQDLIASQILETLDDEEAWARSFREKPLLFDGDGFKRPDGRVDL